MCQCPQRAYFHFYKWRWWKDRFHSTCQCPQRAYFHFYVEENLQKELEGIVSMPSTGLLSFLRGNCTTTYLEIECVNALNGLTFISTMISKVQKFYEERVNALNGLTFISTTFTAENIMNWEGVNALNGLTFISTKVKNLIKTLSQYVSMPSTGLLSFLLNSIPAGLVSSISVSMPSTGLLSFLLIQRSGSLWF